MKSLLIAEGHDGVAHLFGDLFSRDAWTVTVCRNGLRALETLRGSALYDAVLVNSRLHDVSGVDLITRIRALDHRKDVPIVMLTGTVSVEVVAAALAAGADDVLYKPVDVAILVATVSKCAERSVALFTSDSSPSSKGHVGRRCPHCGSAAVFAREHVFADRTGRIRGEDYRCRDCGQEFVLLPKLGVRQAEADGIIAR